MYFQYIKFQELVTSIGRGLKTLYVHTLAYSMRSMLCSVDAQRELVNILLHYFVLIHLNEKKIFEKSAHGFLPIRLKDNQDL